jgi:hypothetical protein
MAEETDMSSIDELIGAEVERSFADEPLPRDPREYVARGRRARLRRRAATTVAGLVAAAAVTGIVLHAVPGDPTAQEVGPATGVTAVEVPRFLIPIDPDAHGSLALAEDGSLVRGSRDVEVTGYYANVITGAIEASAAVEAVVDGRTVWALLTRARSDGTTTLQTAPPDPSRTFDEWVRASARDGSGGWFTYRPDPDGPGEGATPR